MIRYEWYLTHIKEYLESVYDTYASFYPAVFVTYYQNMPVEFDKNTHAGYMEPGNSLSPNRYRKIISVPVFMSEVQNVSTAVTEQGVEISDAPFSITMMGKIGIVPRPNDFLIFPNPAEPNEIVPIYHVATVDPAVATSIQPMTAEKQAYKVQIDLIGNTSFDIESKVQETVVYIDRFGKFLNPEQAVIYIDTLELRKELESYFDKIEDKPSGCMVQNNLKLYNCSYLRNQLNITEYSTYQYSTNIPVTTYTHSILDQVILDPILTSVTEWFQPIESTISGTPKSEILHKLYKRKVYVSGVETPHSVNFYDIFYPSSTNEARDIIDHINFDKGTSSYTLINSTHNLALIYNKWVNWSTSQTSSIRSAWNNIFEALLLYSYTGKILWTLTS